MREAVLERKCCEFAKANGWLAYKFVSPSQAGVPDRLFIRASAVIFVEFKRVGEQLRPLQQRVIDNMRLHGATVHVIRRVEEFIDVMS